MAGCVISVITLAFMLILLFITRTGVFKFNPPLYVEEAILEEIITNDSTVFINGDNSTLDITVEKTISTDNSPEISTDDSKEDKF